MPLFRERLSSPRLRKRVTPSLSVVMAVVVRSISPAAGYAVRGGAICGACDHTGRSDRRARANEPTFAAAVAAQRMPQLDRSIARAALLPSAAYLQPVPLHAVRSLPESNTICAANAGVKPAATGTAISTVPRFIANNTVHEYISQGR